MLTHALFCAGSPLLSAIHAAQTSQHDNRGDMEDDEHAPVLSSAYRGAGTWRGWWYWAGGLGSWEEDDHGGSNLQLEAGSLGR